MGIFDAFHLDIYSAMATMCRDKVPSLYSYFNHVLYSLHKCSDWMSFCMWIQIQYCFIIIIWSTLIAMILAFLFILPHEKSGMTRCIKQEIAMSFNKVKWWTNSHSTIIMWLFTLTARESVTKIFKHQHLFPPPSFFAFAFSLFIPSFAFPPTHGIWNAHCRFPVRTWRIRCWADFRRWTTRQELLYGSTFGLIPCCWTSFCHQWTSSFSSTIYRQWSDQ